MNSRRWWLGVLLCVTACAFASTKLPTYKPNIIPGMARVDNKSYYLKAAVWTNPNIPVCWEALPPETATERQLVRDAVAKSWEMNSKVRFVPKEWPQCARNAAGIRITVEDSGPQTSNLGNRIRGYRGMILNFTFGKWGKECAGANREKCIRSIAVHEFGHVLAFSHEQNRPDKPGECTKKPQGPDGDVMLTPWDPASVMNYCNSRYNNNGVLSEGDIKTVRAIYGY